MIIESYETEAATSLIKIGAAISIRAKFWRKSKTIEERKSFAMKFCSH